MLYSKEQTFQATLGNRAYVPGNSEKAESSEVRKSEI